MENITRVLQAQFPHLTFTAGATFCWSPSTHEVLYNAKIKGKTGIWSLLHETGHATLEHTAYTADFELLQLEVAAWEQARTLATQFALTIEDDHIQDCLDTYRDWLYKRSICPNCTTKCLQQSDNSKYRCFNCHTGWNVSPSRFCRSYRSTKDSVKPVVATFQARNTP